MTWPEPAPGLVIRYSRLWDREARAGREEGVRDQPCAIILTKRERDGRTRVMVLPVTHTEPADQDRSVEIPLAVKRHLRLDDDRSWVMLTEVNTFIWPGPDLHFLSGEGPGSSIHGTLPPALFRTIRDRFLALWAERRARVVSRTE